jgi:hypothetical protein
MSTIDPPWTTRADPKFTRQYGVEEVHSVCFEPPGWPGRGPVVHLGIPECELLVGAPVAGDDLVIVIREKATTYRNLKYWTIVACNQAIKHKAFIMLACDTAQQAEVGAKRIAKQLPQYRRVALERMYDPDARVREKLS